MSGRFCAFLYSFLSVIDCLFTFFFRFFWPFQSVDLLFQFHIYGRSWNFDLCCFISPFCPDNQLSSMPVIISSLNIRNSTPLRLMMLLLSLQVRANTEVSPCASGIYCHVLPATHKHRWAFKLTRVRFSHLQRPCLSRRSAMQEQVSSSFMESPPPPHLDGPFFGAELLPSARLRRMRGYRPSPGGLEEEIMMFQTRVLLGGMSMYDRYQDWRLDVDNMTYEELLELGERIGHVNTGLREDEIVRNLRKVKHPALDSSFRFPTEVEKKCSICQEEFEANDEMGRLHCGHSYHVYCIKKWLSQKNVCPVCKTAVTKT